MPIQVLDYSLSNFKVPGLAQYTPPFGTKKADGLGLTTTEIARNEMMPFMKQRPISGNPAITGNDPPTGVISEDSLAKPIEFDANFAVAAGVHLQLSDPLYEGQEIRVVASFNSGSPATIVLGETGTPDKLTLNANSSYLIIAINGKWKDYITTIPLAPLNSVESVAITAEWMHKRRPIGKVSMWLREPTPQELIWQRQLPLNGQTALISLYEDFFNYMHQGQDYPWWYRCNENGEKNDNGDYFLVLDCRGMFFRGVGANSIYKAANDTPYDGKGVGEFIRDGMPPIKGIVGTFATNTNEGKGAFSIMLGYPNMAALGSHYGGPCYSFDSNRGTITDNPMAGRANTSAIQPASISTVFYISY
jgi:hypothetical protein